MQILYCFSQGGTISSEDKTISSSKSHDVFISFAGDDKTGDQKAAVMVCDYLEIRGIKCWLYHRDELKGEEFERAIMSAIKNSKALVLIYTAKTNNSFFVEIEIRHAAKCRIPIIPFKMEDAPYNSVLDFYLTSHNWLDATVPPIEVHLQKLAENISKLIQKELIPASTSAYQEQRRDGNTLTKTSLMKSKEDIKNKKRNATELFRPKNEKPFQLKNKLLLVSLIIVIAGFWMISSLMKDNTITSQEVPLNYTNSIGMDFVLISSGEFQMGSDAYGKDYTEELPVHNVTIGKAFYLGKYEVTQAQWAEVMGTNPSVFKGDNNPVNSVSWYDAQEFIKKLNSIEGTEKYRLPSEAEWEYACRAGTNTAYSFGDNKLKLEEYAWYIGYESGQEWFEHDGENISYYTHPVGQKKPNPWGLYDMHGNVEEWVQDEWHESYAGAPNDGSAWESGDIPLSSKMIRGGGYRYSSGRCRSASRGSSEADSHYEDSGFRLLMEL